MFMGECLFKEKTLPLFKTFLENLNCSRRMKSRGGGFAQVQPSRGGTRVGQETKAHAPGGAERGRGGSEPSGV